MQLPVFVINLDRRPDRWAAMSGQLDRLGIEPVRIPALDAEQATTKNFEPYVSLDVWARRREHDFASAACFVSHRAALVTFLDETAARFALILEDDVKLASDLPLFLEAAVLMLPSTCLLNLDVVVGHRRPRRPLGRSLETVQGRKLHPIATWIPGAGAYLVTRAAAETIVERCHGVTEAFDVFVFDMRVSKLARQLRPLLAQPALADHQASVFTSDIEKWRKAAPTTSAQRRLAIVLRKLPRQTFVGWSLATGQMKRTKLRFSDRA